MCIYIYNICVYIYIYRNFHVSFGSEHLQVNNLQFYDLAEHVCQVDLKGIHYIKVCSHSMIYSSNAVSLLSILYLCANRPTPRL